MQKRDPGQLRTQFSIQAQDLAKTFTASLGRMRLAPGDYVPELTAPEGPSTGGGVQALQRLRLVSANPSFPTIVVGGVNQKDGTAELRTYEHVEALHLQRFKRPIALDRAQYEGFLGMASNFLGVLKLRITMSGPPAIIPQDSSPALPDSAEPGTGASKAVLFGILLAALVIVGVVLWLFVFRK